MNSKGIAAPLLKVNNNLITNGDKDLKSDLNKISYLNKRPGTT